LFDIRCMTVEDLDFAVRITQAEGWGYGREDMNRILRWSPDGCFVVWMDGSRVGMATTLHYSTFGWIGNVVVSTDTRCRGIGTMLTKHCISHIIGKGARGVRLFAYKNTVAFYERIGFRQDSAATVFRRSPSKWGPALAPEGFVIAPLKRENHAAAISLDMDILGGDRSHVLRTIWSENPGLSLGLWEKDRMRLRAVLVGKKVLGNIEVGPWISDLPGTEGPLALADHLLAATDTAIFMAVPDAQTSLMKALGERGFTAVDKVYGMFVSQPPPTRTDHILAYGALEKG